MNTEHRVIIIGGGPAGLTAGIYAARANLQPLIVAGIVNTSAESEDFDIPGGQLMVTNEVENYPGFPEGIIGPVLIEKFEAQAVKFGATRIEERATDFQFSPGGPFVLKVGDNDYETEAIILANGASAKWLSLLDEKKYRGHGISACATCDGPLPYFKGKHIYVVGGGWWGYCHGRKFIFN